jgi:methionine sulfoxide reductase heme-binding subunit
VTKKQLILAKLGVWILCLLPFLRLIWRGWNQTRGIEPDLGANPIEFITLSTGTWTLVFLLASLAITPLRRITGWNSVIKFRRLLGLFAYFYVCLHFLIYLILDRERDLSTIVEDIAKRPFITVGFLGFVLLTPLAITSTTGWIRRLGGKWWNRIHQLVYFAAIAGVVHFWWKVKADIREPAMYAAVLALLLAYRVVRWGRQRQVSSSSFLEKSKKQILRRKMRASE